MDLQLTDTETAVLRELLESALRNVREEVYKTDDYDYKELVKGREAIVQTLLQKVRPAGSGSASGTVSA